MKYRMVVVEGGWSGRDSGNGKLLGCGFIILLRKMKSFVDLLYNIEFIVKILFCIF